MWERIGQDPYQADSQKGLNWMVDGDGMEGVKTHDICDHQDDVGLSEV